MIVTVQLEEHDAPQDPWVIQRAILEAIEPGAGAHCVERFPDRPATIRHYRLGVTIEVHPTPLPLPVEMGNSGGRKR